ncbi:unnamed protein product [Prunus armeniaca]|uniref:Uncharacterized protein n=1 Tax=Prunus armeniaca TaxID=36596 RepID=A0A6J5VBG3_PRUAR|nr:unnamed protein product [Prunus armeniaca]
MAGRLYALKVYTLFGNSHARNPNADEPRPSLTSADEARMNQERRQRRLLTSQHGRLGWVERNNFCRNK